MESPGTGLWAWNQPYKLPQTTPGFGVLAVAWVQGETETPTQTATSLTCSLCQARRQGLYYLIHASQQYCKVGNFKPICRWGNGDQERPEVICPGLCILKVTVPGFKPTLVMPPSLFLRQKKTSSLCCHILFGQRGHVHKAWKLGSHFCSDFPLCRHFHYIGLYHFYNCSVGREGDIVISIL